MLTSGVRIGPYEIVAPIGAGGMGEVYRARDNKLNREVAFKVLPDEFAQDGERLARFKREAQVLASLNHPNIAAIYGLEESDGTLALAMELVEGLTLSDRVAAGRVPLDEALEIAGQIAKALEAAHERGIVHRDLKPANVKVTSDGTVKVLDFGLAKVFEGEFQATDLSHSPTLIKGTQAGMILGTAAYMSPEQAKGKTVDKRADIWALGCVLFEMLTGKQTFSGETLTDVLASVVRADPDWDALPAGTPDTIRRLLRRCLTRDTKQRLRDIGEARIQIERTISGEADESTRDAQSPTTIVGPSRRLRLLPWAIAGFAIVAAGLTIAHYRTINPEESSPLRRFVLASPAQGRLTSLLLSPDGTRLISTVRESGRWRLFERLLSAPDARLIEGSQGAIDPFFSPDGKFVGFFANGLLKKVSLSGGAPETVCNAQNDRGAVWGPDDNIVFAPGTDVPLHRVRASGGPVEVISTLDVSARERSHRWPDVLPDGKSILFTIAYEVGNPLDDASIAVLDLATGKHKTLIKSAAFARYSQSGHIVYARSGGIVAVPFNVDRLEVTGPPVTFPENVLMSVTNGGAQFSLSHNGDLAYVVGRSDDSRALMPLVWLDRRGGEQVLSDVRHRYSMPRLTSDGRTLLIELGDSGSSIWAYDLGRGTLSRITFGGVSYNPTPAPDGKRVAYEAVRDGVAGVLLARLDGSGEERLTATKRLHIPTSWTPDGKTLAITAGSESGFLEIWLVTVDGDRKPQTFLHGPFNVGGASFSPDGRWVAYVSDESGRNEVYVRRYPESGNRFQISADGGSEPVWARNGRELFFRNGDELLAVDMALQGDFTAGHPRLLFSRYNPQSESGVAYDLVPDYDVSPDGQRFVIPKRELSNNPTGGVVLNWFEELRRLAPTP